MRLRFILKTMISTTINYIVNQVSIYSIDSLGTNPLMLTGSNPHKWDDYYVSVIVSVLLSYLKASKDFKSITISFIDHRFEEDKTYIKAMNFLINPYG